MYDAAFPQVSGGFVIRNVTLLPLLICLISVLEARAQEFSALGSFENVRETSISEEPHCYGWSLELWRYRGHILGLLDRHAGLCGDPPCQTVTDVSYDAKSGRLAFAAFAMSFVGTLRTNELVGTLGTERVRLKRSKMPPMDAASDRSLDAWCQFWRGVRRCKGIGELCRALDVRGQ
jgi:hypothetical protein